MKQARTIKMFELWNSNGALFLKNKTFCKVIYFSLWEMFEHIFDLLTPPPPFTVFGVIGDKI